MNASLPSSASALIQQPYARPGPRTAALLGQSCPTHLRASTVMVLTVPEQAVCSREASASNRDGGVVGVLPVRRAGVREEVVRLGRRDGVDDGLRGQRRVRVSLSDAAVRVRA